MVDCATPRCDSVLDLPPAVSAEVRNDFLALNDDQKRVVLKVLKTY